MNTLFPLLRYLLTWQRLLGWLLVTGLVALALTPAVAALLSPRTAFAVFVFGYMAALMLPCCAAPVAFRHLISSRRLALVPGLLQGTGLALLLLAVLLGILPVLGSALYGRGMTGTLVALRIFICASAYFALMQWALSSRYMVVMVSLGPFLTFLLLNRTAPLWGPLLGSPFAHWLGAAFCLGGWLLALYCLSRRRDFRPVTQVSPDPHGFSGRGWNILNPASLYRVRTAAGSMLLGYPDGIGGRLMFLAGNMLLAPLLGSLLMWLISAGESWPWSTEHGWLVFYLMFSMVTTIAYSISNGELAARCRQLWLRHGSDRAGLWRFMETRLLTNSLLLGLLLLPQSLLANAILGNTMNFHFLYDYLLGTLSCFLLGSYFGLAARIYQWSLVVQLLMVLLLGPGVALSFNQQLVPIPLLSLAVLGMALLFRRLAMKRFLRIDWYLVKPRTSSAKTVTR